MKERESQRKLRELRELERKSWVTELRELRELERNFWLRELREIVVTVFFFNVKMPCNFFNIIRVN